jgi:hypothetical protein
LPPVPLQPVGRERLGVQAAWPARGSTCRARGSPPRWCTPNR